MSMQPISGRLRISFAGNDAYGIGLPQHANAVGDQESQNMRRATHTNSNEPRRCISYMIMGRGALR